MNENTATIVDTEIKSPAKKLSIGALFRNGSVIILEARIWSGTTKLAPADLGVPDTQEVRDSLNFGTERLVPKELLSPLLNIRTTAHALINSYSADFPFLPGQKFTPKQLVDGLETALKALQEEFYNHKDGVVIPKFQEEAEKQLLKTEEALKKATEGKPNSIEIVQTALARIRTKLPDEKMLANKFHFGWAARSVDFRKDKSLDAALEAMDAAQQETETVKENIAAIVHDYSGRVKDLIDNVQGMSAKGSKPTAATIKSIKNLREKIVGLNMFGGQNLLAVLDNLLGLVDTNIELAKLEQDKATIELNVGVEALSKTLDEATIKAIDEAVDLLSAGPEISL